MEKITLGVSTCLLGYFVRYDGGHKLDRYVRDILGHYFQYAPVCPEVECGMPTPREALHLVGDPGSPGLLSRKSRRDYTEQMQQWGRGKLGKLVEADICGYIFKSRSPSCGMEGIKVYNEQGSPGATSAGIWAGMLLGRFPFLPVEEDVRLKDPGLRERFIEHVFVYWRWRQLRTDLSCSTSSIVS